MGQVFIFLKAAAGRGWQGRRRGWGEGEREHVEEDERGVELGCGSRDGARFISVHITHRPPLEE